MKDLTVAPALPEGSRPETGPMQFGDDWPGVFIRGDNALVYAINLQMVLEQVPAEMWTAKAMLTGLLRTLQSCNVRHHQ